MDKKKPNGCAIGCLAFVVTFVFLLIIGSLFSCGRTSIDIDKLIEDGQNYVNEIEDIHLGTQTNEEKLARLDEIQTEIEPVIEDLEKSKDENEYEFGADFQLWEAYGGIRLMCNDLKTYIENGNQEALNDYYKAKHATEDNIRLAIEKKND